MNLNNSKKPKIESEIDSELPSQNPITPYPVLPSVQYNTPPENPDALPSEPDMDNPNFSPLPDPEIIPTDPVVDPKDKEPMHSIAPIPENQNSEKNEKIPQNTETVENRTSPLISDITDQPLRNKISDLNSNEKAGSAYDLFISEHIKKNYLLLKDNMGWQKSYDQNNTQGYTKIISGCPISLFKVTSTLNISPSIACHTIWSFTIKDWKKMDSNTLHFEIKLPINENAQIIWQANNLPWPLWSRDILSLTIKTSDDKGTFMILSSSDGVKEPHPWPCDTTRFVRSHLYYNSYIFEAVAEQQNKCKLTRFVHVDPSGNIPASVVNSQAGRIYQQPKYFNNLFKSLTLPSYSQ